MRRPDPSQRALLMIAIATLAAGCGGSARASAQPEMAPLMDAMARSMSR